jgi:hypothetical protein
MPGVEDIKDSVGEDEGFTGSGLRDGLEGGHESRVWARAMTSFGSVVWQ